MKKMNKLNAIWLPVLIAFLMAGCRMAHEKQPKPRLNEGYVEVEGGRIWYRILGQVEKTPLIAMHGGPGGTHRSFYLLEPITEDRPLILFDQLGSGKSGAHRDTSLLKVDNFVEQVHALRKALDLDEVYLLGASWGTALALESYLAHPEGVKGIVFSSPYFSTPVWEADADTLITYLPDSIQQAIEEGERSGDFDAQAYQEANRVFLENYGRRKDRVSTPWDTVQAPRSSFIYNYMWGPTEFTATGTLKNYHRIESLSQVKVPVLFLTGEYDEARPATVQRFQNLVPGSEFEVIEGAGHSTLNDNTEQSLKAIRDFLNDLDQKE